MGICSVHYGEQTVIICPIRFLENDTVFSDIVTNYYGNEITCYYSRKPV